LDAFMRRLKLMGAVAAAASLLGAGAAPALAVGYDHDGEHEVGLHQTPPITADDPEFDLGEECSGIPEGSDGWHFVLPGDSTTFVELRVTFEPGGEQVVTVFGPPSEKHAHVASEAGAELTGASATVMGEAVDFRLSHTCPAAVTPTPTPTETATPTPSPSVPEPTEDTPSEEPTGDGTPTPEPSVDETPPGGEDPETPAEDDEDLAETGSSTPVLPLTIGAVVLLGAGAYLALRFRRSSGS
jgi:LPXTG-motif cell wall-anchored protein